MVLILTKAIVPIDLYREKMIKHIVRPIGRLNTLGLYVLMIMHGKRERKVDEQ